MVNSMVAVLALSQQETKCCVCRESPAQAYCTMMIGSEAQLPPTWGSMHKGHLRPWSTAMAFSDEMSSLGRPQMFHCRILTASPRAADRLKLGLQGTPAASHAATQPAKQSDLCTDVKGPVHSTRFHLAASFRKGC